jgi:glucan phosphoethanolaminetransferase (alkaline phosphatase superfamily)
MLNANMITAAWTVIILEIALLLVWIYSIFIKTNGTDPAGKGTAMVFVIGLILYIVAGMVLVWAGRTWSLVLAIVMGVVPMMIVAKGLWKEYGPSGKRENY